MAANRIAIRIDTRLRTVYKCGCEIEVNESTDLLFTCPHHGCSMKKLRCEIRRSIGLSNDSAFKTVYEIEFDDE